MQVIVEFFLKYYLSQNLSDFRCLLHVPMNEMLSPYHYPTAPVGSRIESENQSLSSDAMTEDTLSVTTDSALTE